jgi:probable RNA-binding protein EIF1AD
MAGLGRRTHYRKHLTDSVLFDFPEPQEGEKIAKVVATRGGNQFDVKIHGDKKTLLAILPTKFRKLVWVKRNDFVIVQTTDETSEDETGSIKCIITHILYKEQVKHLLGKGLWPDDDPEFDTGSIVESDDEQVNEDGIVYENDDDSDLFVNTNRIAALKVQDSSSEGSSDEDD